MCSSTSGKAPQCWTLRDNPKGTHTQAHAHTRIHTQHVKSHTEVQYIPDKPIKGASYNSLSQNTERGEERKERTERETGEEELRV